MAIIAISIDEAFAQGSTWPQMSSVAKFHKEEIKRKLNASREVLPKMAEWKAKKFKYELDQTVKLHREHADYFEAMSKRMREITEEIERAE